MSVRLIRKMLAPLERRVMLMVGRCVLTAIDDSTRSQTLQIGVLEDEVKEEVERFQEYGFTSHPPINSEGVVVHVAGNRGHPIVIATEFKEGRPTGLAEGEVALWDFINGIRVQLKAGGEVHMGTLPTAFVALADLTDSRISTLQVAHDGHVHGGVTTGGGSTLVPTSLIGALATVAAIEVKAK